MSVVGQESDSPFVAKKGVWDRVDRWIERAGEKLNPILVKEARQALKSKQFLITFILLLICGWGWSLLSVAILGRSVYYAPSGPFLLIGYTIVLTVPLLLIVPFAAYRSLASEREDGTFDLLSITTLSSRQIVSGKLGSAVLQMIVYYSALSPCIAFTYLLRGIDIVTIMLFLVYTFLASLLLSVFGLMVATITHIRHLQILLSVALLLGLVAATIGWCSLAIAIVVEADSAPYDEVEFWIGQLALLTGYVGYLLLFLLAAGAQLSFASDNRSTKLRVVMLVHQVLFTGWVMYYWLKFQWGEIPYFFLACSGIHWMTMGSLMTGELAQLSPRVKRRLPQSFMGRAFLTWFNPGSGTGYLFAVVNLTAVGMLAVAAAVIADWKGSRCAPDEPEFFSFTLLLCAYLAAYLGVGRLLVLWIRRYLNFGLLLPFLVHNLLLFLGAALPTFLQAWLYGFDDFDDYTFLQIPNWMWTLIEAGDGDIWATPGAPVVVLVGAAAIFLVNMIVAAKEVEEVRQEEPERVRQDDLELHPELAPKEEKPTSPFDD